MVTYRNASVNKSGRRLTGRFTEGIMKKNGNELSEKGGRRMKRSALLCLLAFCLLLTAVGCDGITPSSSSSGLGNTPSTGAASANDADITVLFAPYDFEDRTYTVFTEAENVCNVESFGNGNFLEDAVYRRNTAVERMLSVKIHYAVFPSHSEKTVLYNALLADWKLCGGETYDLVMLPAVTMGLLSVYEGAFADLRRVPGVNLSAEWWSPSAVEEMTVNGRTHMTVGFINHDAIENACVILCNRTVFSNLYKNRDLYSLVKEQKWTWDQLFRLSVAASSSTAVREGFMGDLESIAEMVMQSPTLAVFGERIPTGYRFDAAKAEERLSRLRIWETTPKANWTLVDSRATALAAFSVQETLFCNARLGDLSGGLSVPFEWMMLPLPLNAEGEEYRTAVADGFSMLAVPVAKEDSLMCGVVLEALNAYAFRTMLPTVYNHMLAGRYSSNQPDAEMMDRILEARCFSFGRIYGGTATEHAGEYGVLFHGLLTGEPIEKQLTERSDAVRTHWMAVFCSFGISKEESEAFPMPVLSESEELPSA